MISLYKLLLLCTALVLFLLRRRYRSSLNTIPGPLLASFSKVWQMWHVAKGDTETITLELHRRHGHFVRLSHDEVSCSHPDAIRAILLAPLVKGDWYKACAIPDRYHQTAMSEVDPARKNAMKKIFASGYSPSNVLRSEAHLDLCLDLLSGHLARLADTQKSACLEDWFHYWSFDSIAGLVFSGSFGFLESARDIGGSIANARFFMLYLSITAHVYWVHDILFGNPMMRWLNLKPTQHIMDSTNSAAEIRRRDPGAKQDMIEQWGTSLKKTPDAFLKEEDLVQNAASTIIAGSETTAAALQSFVYFSLRFSKPYNKLLAEIDAASAGGKLSPKIQASEVLELPYLQATLKELLRYFPPVPSGLTRKVPAGGVKIGDQHFSAGTTLSVNPHVIHRSKECFGDTADEFMPERWLGDDGKAIEKFFLPFGMGYNSCPGRPVAFIQLSKAAATLVRDFKFELIDEGKPWKYRNSFTVVPYDWPCRVKRRS